MRTIRISKAEFDAKKIEETDAELIVKDVVLTREAILPFADGKGYRSAEELKAATWTLEGSWLVALDHIDTVFVTDPKDIRGKISNVRFCDKINGVLGDAHFFKAKCEKAFVDGIRSGKLKDVSVAYFCEDVFTPGKFVDEPYDFVQQNFMFGHVAAGIPEGRCPSPFCGMALDQIVRRAALFPLLEIESIDEKQSKELMDSQIFKDFRSKSFYFPKVSHKDPEVTENYVRIRVRDPGLFVDGSFRTIVLSADQGIHAIIGKLKSDPSGSTVIQNYMFEIAKGWTMEKAQAWVSQHKDSRFDAEWTTEYINNLPDECFAYIEEGGKKDDEGKTVPRSLRHLEFKNAQGEIDHDHLVAALQALSGARTGEPLSYAGKAKPKLCAAVNSWNRDHPDSKIESDVCGTADSSCHVDSFAEIKRSRKLLSR
jgi:hypothetical protein